MKKYDTLIFDLDGTLAVSKSAIDSEMADLLAQLTYVANVVIITGGNFDQIQKQVLNRLPSTTNLSRCYIFPTSGSQMLHYRPEDGDWEVVYEKILTNAQRKKIIDSLVKALSELSYTITPNELKGDQIEDRGSQITLSMLGQEQTPEVKALWDPDMTKRREIVDRLHDLHSEFDVKIGGATSIDITLKGIDKAFSIREFYRHTSYDIQQGIFIGDRIIPGGNDWSATETGIETRSTSDPEETKVIIKNILETLRRDVIQ